MEIIDLQQIAESIYHNIPAAYQRGGDVYLLNLHIKAMQNLKETNKIHYINPLLTDLEILSIVILEGFGSSQLIQSSLYHPQQSNELKEILVDNLDSALKKTPQNTHTTLFANDGFQREDNKVGDTFTIQGYFTTSKEDFDNAQFVKWIIEPLSQNQTKAHEIYQIYNHGENCPYPEYQVEFERGTSFVITDIRKQGDYDIIYIKELP